ncbi:glycosyl transferase family 2 [Novosphingobium sp. Rr 2-17]|uniref:glycosyltransferase n=1 Tax=Novosphingobium sp. Rr 2-17 TaxID=555793 RepID=UPI0002699B8E|nr:glycosyltransferase [Novosphingobium sp. Rr 2-17]EIZ79787.1 glycosyl transferase family 2 [Novosphingobium sp. Rr 2-17]
MVNELNHPKISVVIPAWNAAKYLAATLQSVADQCLENVEIILIDGGSTDDTLSIARSFDGLAISILSEPDRGQLDALQKGLKLASGDIVLWLNADDVVMPGSFLVVLEQFKDSSVDFVFSDDVAFNEETGGFYYGPSIKGLNDLDHLLFYRQLYSECVYWRRSITTFLEDEYFDLRVYTDYAFFLRLRWGRKGRWVSKRLGAFRIRTGQASEAFSTKKKDEYIRIKKQHCEHIGMPFIQYMITKIVYMPWFVLRQRIRPQIMRGIRRAFRFFSGDKGRVREANFFFENWLLPINSRTPRNAV